MRAATNLGIHFSHGSEQFGTDITLRIVGGINCRLCGLEFGQSDIRQHGFPICR